MSLQAIPKSAIGIACAIIASIAFTLNDSGVKFLSGGYPLHEVVLIRALVGASLTFFILIPLEGGYSILKTSRPLIHLCRGLLVVMANMLFFLGLAVLPVADTTAIFFVAPLIITAFSVIFLKEKVSFLRWSAVAVGLCGVMIIARPGSESFQYAAFLPLAAAVCYAGMHTLTRKIGVSEKAATMAFYIQLTFVVVSAGFGLVAGDGRFAGSEDPSIDFLLRSWIWPERNDWFVMFGLGLLSATGGYFISQAYRQCEAALIAPCEYLSMILAVIWGITIFGEWPDWVTYSGIGLIVSAGWFVFWREMHLNKLNAIKRPMPRQR
jgi:drug/metabolite transporter (DMT)-like permease